MGLQEQVEHQELAVHQVQVVQTALQEQVEHLAHQELAEHQVLVE